MNSFNVYGQTEKKIGGNTPVWLGTVKPIPRGAVLEESLGEYEGYIPAGTAVKYDDSIRTFTALSLADLAEANGFLYNDVVATDYAGVEERPATAAIVMHHPEGLLIERVYPNITEEQIQQLQARIPGVLLVRG